MKSLRIILFVGIASSVLFSCKSFNKINTSDNDDVYLSPKKDRKEFYKPDEPKVATVAVTPAAKQDSVENPYYKEKDFNYDDYYDNQYASRLKRFHSPMYGVSYYDSYYTNSYFYNNNPYQYGVSIYNGYGFWGPSYNNYMYVPNYNWGGNYGYGTNYGYNSYCGNNWGYGYNNYGYNNYNNNYWNSPYYGNYYGGWGNPFYNSYYNNNNYGYNNGYDYNSNAYNGPRISHSGGNSKKVINPGFDNGKVALQPVVDNTTPKAAYAPTDIKRFNIIEAPKQNVVKGNQNESVPHTFHNNNNAGSTSTPSPVKNNSQPIVNEPYNAPVKGNSNPPTTVAEPKRGSFNDNGNAPVIPKTKNNATPPPEPKKSYFDNNSNSGGTKTTVFPSSSGGGSNGGGTVRPSSNGGGTIKPRK